MKRLATYFSCLGVLMTMGSCAPAFYIPNQLNMPMAEGGQSGKIALNTGTGCLGGEASYAITNHFLVLADGMYNNFSFIGTNKTYSYYGGVGYYTNTPNSWEVIGGYGFGSADADILYATQTSYSRTNEHDIVSGYYHRIFVQFDFSPGATNESVVFGLRVSNLMPDKFNYQVILHSSSEPGLPQQPPYLISNHKWNALPNTFLLEPVLKFNREIFSNGYFQTSIGFSVNISNTITDNNLKPALWPVIANAGLCYRF